MNRSGPTQPPAHLSPPIAPVDPTPLAPVPAHVASANGAQRQMLHIDTSRSTVPPRGSDAAATPASDRLIDRRRAELTAGTADARNDTLASRVERAFHRELRIGLRVLIGGGVLIGAWSALMPLAGAVAVPGNLVVQSNVKAIQHPTGGIVAQIPVHNGMRVNAGDLLLQLDATQARASLQVVSKQLDEFRVRIARLMAERDAHAQIETPPEMAARSAETGVNALLASEESLFKARANARQSQKDLLQSRVAQLGEEISGLDAQLKSKASQLELIGGELS